MLKASAGGALYVRPKFVYRSLSSFVGLSAMQIWPGCIWESSARQWARMHN